MLHTDLLDSQNSETIHSKSLEILENTGIAFNYDPALQTLKRHGAKVDGRIAHIPADLVAKCLSTCPPQFTWEARNPARNVVFGNKQQFLVLPNLGPVFIKPRQGPRRHGKMADYINITKLSQASAVVDVVGSCPIDAADADPETKFLHMMYHSCRHSDKPVLCCTGSPRSTDRQLEILELAFGQPGIMKKKIITGTSLSPLSPLAYSEDAAHAIMAHAANGQAVIVACAPMSGINAPASIAGTSLTINTEFLAAMVLAQCAGPGAPVVYATTASASNLRHATFVVGIPETTLLNCFAAQMGRYYHIPTRSVGAATDAKSADIQAGYEAMQTLLLTCLSGVDAIYETLGVLDALMSVSYEKFIIDQELVARVRAILPGVNAQADQLYCEDIQQVGIGGNFLIHPATLEACRERWAPLVSDTGDPPGPTDDDRQDIIQRAASQYRDILKSAPDSILDAAIDQEMAAYIEQYC